MIRDNKGTAFYSHARETFHGQAANPAQHLRETAIAAPARRLNALERAIYSTVAYRDVFDYPVTVSELHRYLHGMACSLAEVGDALASGLLIGRYLVTDGEYIALAGRGLLVDIRRSRLEASLRQWPRARRYARFLASLPDVRMVAMTGSLSTGNFPPGGDIDFLLLTEQGTMWRTRALCRLLATIESKAGRGLFCPNMFLSSAAMALSRRTLYDAQELCQMIPLFGAAEYEAVRRANGWTAEYLPNAVGPPENVGTCDPYLPRAKHWAERVLDSPLGRCIENFEARRKLHRFNETERLKGAWTRSTPESHSLWDDMRLKIEGAWRLRMDAITDD